MSVEGKIDRLLESHADVRVELQRLTSATEHLTEHGKDQERRLRRVERTLLAVPPGFVAAAFTYVRLRGR